MLTVEPGLYFQPEDELVPEELRGIGIRIEDDVLVTATGARNLSAGPAARRPTRSRPGWPSSARRVPACPADRAPHPPPQPGATHVAAGLFAVRPRAAPSSPRRSWRRGSARISPEKRRSFTFILIVKTRSLTVGTEPVYPI